MIVQVMDDPTRRTQRLPWMYASWTLPFMLLYVEWSWWKIFVSELESTPTALSVPVPAAAAMSLGGKLLAHASEAGLYVLLWRVRGARLPYWRFLVYIIVASLADQFAWSLAEPFKAGGAPLWRIALAGLHLASGTPFHDSASIRAAFGSIGLLTAARIGVTAAPQSRATGRPFVEALAWTVGIWLLTRIAVWWAFDLLRGMSPLGG
jgi:hypothetical protein